MSALTLLPDLIPLFFCLDRISLWQYNRYRLISKEIGSIIASRITSFHDTQPIRWRLSVSMTRQLSSLKTLPASYRIVIDSMNQLTEIAQHKSLCQAVIDVTRLKESLFQCRLLFFQWYHPQSKYSFILTQQEERITQSETTLDLHALSSHQPDTTAMYCKTITTYIGRIDRNLDVIKYLPSVKTISLRFEQIGIIWGLSIGMEAIAGYCYRCLFKSGVTIYRIKYDRHSDEWSYLSWIRNILYFLDCHDMYFPDVIEFFPIPLEQLAMRRVRVIFPGLTTIKLIARSRDFDSDLILLCDNYETIYLDVNSTRIARMNELLARHPFIQIKVRLNCVDD